MNGTFPKDADGDALRRVAGHADMSRPMVIDFFVDAPTQTSADAVATAASVRGYGVSVERDMERQRWTCVCSKRMLATYDNVVAAQRELDELGGPVGARSDGWGTGGN
jgi:hypothetical protein